MNRSRATFALLVMAATLLFAAGPAAAQDPAITLDPYEDLADGDTVTVTATGFPASGDSFVSGQCVTPIEDPLAQCDVGNIVPVPLDANGEATFDIVVRTGVVGSGTCGSGGDDCVILVGSLTEPENAAAPIEFAEEGLAETGPSNLITYFSIGIALLAVGGLVVIGSRRYESRIA